MKDLDIGKRIKQVRLDYGLTQAEFATEIGKSQGYINLMEKGNIYSDQVLSQIANKFSISENWIRTGNGEVPEIHSVEMEEIVGDVGSRIVELRSSLGLTQQQFAEMLQCSRPAIANIESGNRKPYTSLLRQIAAKTNAPLSYLLKGTPLPANWLPSSDFIDADLATIIRYLISHEKIKSEVLAKIREEETKVMTIVGANIRRMRKERKWTQEELGEKVGCSNTMIRFYENGKNLPSMKVLSRLAEVFVVDIEFLLTYVY